MTRVLRVRVKDKHAAFLNHQAIEVNQIWNYSQDLALKVLEREHRFMSAYDMAQYTKGAGKEGLSLHSQTVQGIFEEYCIRRKQFKKAKLRWRVSHGSRRSLGSIPFKAVALQYRNGQVHYQGQAISLWDSFGLADYQLRSGSFSEDARGAHACSGSTYQTRWVSGQNGQGRHETYLQSCSTCGGPGRVICRQCSGSGSIRCGECGGNGFFTDITSVVLKAEPHVRITVRSELSRDALSGYLVSLPVAQAVHYFDFTQFNHEDAAADKWQVGYEVHTTLAELDVSLRSKSYMAAADGDKALAFISMGVHRVGTGILMLVTRKSALDGEVEGITGILDLSQ